MFSGRCARDRSGATAVEYGLIAAIVALAIVAALPSTAEGIGAKFMAASTALAE